MSSQAILDKFLITTQRGGWAMSGGHYQYAYYKMLDLAESIEDDAKNADDLPDDIRAHMAYIAEQIKGLSEAAHDIEWLMSTDYGHDTLREHCDSWKLSKHLRTEKP